MADAQPTQEEVGIPTSLRERYQREIERVVTILREHYAPDKVILFGSCGRGDFSEDSDIDLLIVKETSKRPLDRMREVYELAYSPDHYLALDPLVYTPRELTQRLALGDFFIQEIMRERYPFDCTQGRPRCARQGRAHP